MNVKELKEQFPLYPEIRRTNEKIEPNETNREYKVVHRTHIRKRDERFEGSKYYLEPITFIDRAGIEDYAEKMIKHGVLPEVNSDAERAGVPIYLDDNQED